MLDQYFLYPCIHDRQPRRTRQADRSEVARGSLENASHNNPKLLVRKAVRAPKLNKLGPKCVHAAVDELGSRPPVRSCKPGIDDARRGVELPEQRKVPVLRAMPQVGGVACGPRAGLPGGRRCHTRVSQSLAAPTVGSAMRSRCWHVVREPCRKRRPGAGCVARRSARF
jgi:hypothetical protein